MTTDRDLRPLAYMLAGAGIALATAAAIVPHYTAGHKLLAGLLLLGIAPYAIYACFTELIRGWPLALAGGLMLLFDALVKVPARFTRYDGYSDPIVYYVSLVDMAIVLPVILGYGAMRQARAARSAPPEPRDGGDPAS